MRTSFVLGAVGLALGLTAGCNAILGVGDDYTLGGGGTGATAGGSGGHAGSGAQGGTGAQGGSGAQGGTGAQGGSGAQGGTGAQGGSGAQGGTGGCADPTDCPGGDTTCQYRTCSSHICGTGTASADTPCNEPPGQHVCDGQGTCVECNGTPQCSGSDQCIDHSCQSVQCANQVQDPGETDVDCGGPDCAPCANGDSCVTYTDCQSGYCNALVCTACSTSFQCASTALHCDTGVAGGTCVPDLPDGQFCNGHDSWCQSGICQNANDVCCDADCYGLCADCLQVNTGQPDGTCAAMLPGPGYCDPLGCQGTGSEITTAGTCNGVSQDCQGEVSISCNPYHCDSGTGHCRTTCSSGGDCYGGHYCDATGHCVDKKGNGLPCSAGFECSSNNCPGQDGVCCNFGCGGSCQACLGSKTGGSDGTCASITAGTDPDNECSDPTPNCNGSGSCA